MKKYVIENNDYGPGYLLHFADDTYALVNTEYETLTVGDPADLLHMGFWADDDMEPVSPEEKRKINAILKRHFAG